MNEQYHIINRAAVDYLRLTTFMEDESNKLAKVFQAISRDQLIKYPVKNMQYAGSRMEGGFIGIGAQKNQKNTMIELSGSTAQEGLEELRIWLNDEAFVGGVPRIDIQITIERHRTDENLSVLGNRLRDMLELHIKNPKTRPEVRMRDNSRIDNDNTVYIGSRESDRMVRIYDKEINNTEYIRYEIEYKNKTARKVFDEAIKDNDNIAAMIKTDMMRFVRFSTTIQRLYENVPTEQILPTAVIKDKSDAIKRLNYLEWMSRAMARKLTLEGYEKEVVFILESILDEIKEIKR